MGVGCRVSGNDNSSKSCFASLVTRPSSLSRDVEVFIIKETGKNTGIFRAFINTQPGFGREVQGVLEVMPGQEVRFGYVDFANAKGERNKVNELKVPVVGGILQASKKREP